MLMQKISWEELHYSMLSRLDIVDVLEYFYYIKLHHGVVRGILMISIYLISMKSQEINIEKQKM